MAKPENEQTQKGTSYLKKYVSNATKYNNSLRSQDLFGITILNIRFRIQEVESAAES